MKKATIGDLKKLERGDIVYFKEHNTYYNKYTYQGRLFGHEEKYLIFANGSKCKTVYVKGEDKEDLFCTIFVGEYDSTFIGNQIINQAERMIRMVKEIYFKEDIKD